MASLVEQALGLYGPTHSVGLLGAVIGAILILFIWHRLVSSGAISDPGRRLKGDL